MTELSEKLSNLANFFKKTNAKIKLIKLIGQAKNEYDKYDYKSSRETLEEALKLDNKNTVALRGLGCISQFEGDFDKAVEFYKRALKFSKNKEIEYTLIGTVYYFQEKLDEACEYYNLAIDTNDNYDSAYEGRNQAMLENHIKILDLQETLKKYF